MRIQIIEYSNKYKKQVAELVLKIQREEFKLMVTLEEQPDLNQIEDFYRKGLGNFWVAIDEQTKTVVGTIALLDIGNKVAALRKMFVNATYRGKDKQVAQSLLNALLKWCKDKNISAVYLGTIPVFLAAHRFYEKNNFCEIAQAALPTNFPIMRLDTKFYVRKI